MDKSKMRQRMIWMLIGVGLLFGSLYGYRMFGVYMMQKYLASNTRPPATVTAMRVSYQNWQPTLHAIGSLRALQGVNISSEVAGKVGRVYIQSGQQVKKGVLLLELYHADADAQLRALAADAKLAELRFTRDKAQLKARAISRAAFDVSAAGLKRAVAAVQQQRALIARKFITAPFAGRLGIVSINPGAYINPGDVITSLENTESLFVDFHLPQKELGGISVGQLLHIHSDAWPGRVFDGEITAINAAVDSATRNVRIEGRVDKTANTEGQLAPGMFVTLSVVSGKVQHYLTLPQTAVSYNAYGATLFVATRDKNSKKARPGLVAQQEFVKLGATRGDQVAILSGINDGDMIVTSGLMKLKNGTPLLIDNKIQPANDIAPTPQEQ